MLICDANQRARNTSEAKAMEAYMRGISDSQELKDDITNVSVGDLYEKFIGADSEYSDADIVLFGAPFDSTVSFKSGTRLGPSTMRHESIGIETYSPYQKIDLVDVKVHDSGDLDLTFNDSSRMVDLIEEKSTSILSDDKIPFLIGGEHLVTLGNVRAAIKFFPNLRIIHFDAHADLRNDYNGKQLSHACIMRRCHDLLGDGRIWQFGIRSGTRDEFEFIKDGHVVSELFTIKTLPKVSFPKDTPVYLTVDMDVIDPSELPGTGTQEACGIHFKELMDALIDVIERFNVVALDNVELSPPIDPTGRSTALACKLLREELLALGRKKK